MSAKNDCGACEPFAASVRQHFDYLFSELGFRQVACQEFRGGEYCLVGLESAQARMKFELDQGTPTPYFGTLHSPFDRGDEVDGVTVWYVANALLNFVERKAGAPRLGMDGGPAHSADELLAQQATRLRPHAAELERAFAPDAPADWWQAFSAYQDERLQALRRQMGGR
ncbi:MAG: hypothetical protein ABI847_09975 [Anaerolineales bacterium]